MLCSIVQNKALINRTVKKTLVIENELLCFVQLGKVAYFFHGRVNNPAMPGICKIRKIFSIFRLWPFLPNRLVLMIILACWKKISNAKK